MRLTAHRIENPLFVGAYLHLWIGLLLASYHGLEWIGAVPTVGWIGWTHVHVVTIGAFSQLLFGFLPAFIARKLDRPPLPSWYGWAAFVGLNGGLLLAWYGRSFGPPVVFDAGLVVVWLLALGLLLVLLRMVGLSPRGWNATVGLSVLSAFVFLWGITYAYGLFVHLWDVPGGWGGLREAHIHANGWGFFGLAAIGTLYDLFPRLVGTELRGKRLKRYSAGLLAVAIFPLITGPWLGLRLSVTAPGLVLFVVGFVLYLFTLAWTYRAGTSSGVALWLLVAQVWILGPALGAPFVFLGVEWVDPRYIEQGVLHFFFTGWALAIVFAGVLLFASGFAGMRETAPDSGDDHVIPPDPGLFRPWLIGLWTIGLLVLGVGFFYQEEPWAAYPFAAGTAVIAAIWLAVLVRVARLRWAAPSPVAAAER